MLDRNTLCAIWLLKTLNTAVPQPIVSVTKNHHILRLLYELSDASLVEILPESACCRLRVPFYQITLLDVMKAISGHLDITPGSEQNMQAVYGRDGIHLEKLHTICDELLSRINVYGFLYSSREEHLQL
jgi:DNA-binding IscR family transcriptional regulator